MSTRNHDPRPPINQGIDRNNAMVLRHTEIEITLLYQLINTPGHMTMTLNPYGTAPLSAVAGAYPTTLQPIQIQIQDNKGSAPVRYYFTPENTGPTLIPIVGLTPDAINSYSIFVPYVGTRIGTIVTDPLPPTDAQLPPYQSGERFIGFPVCEASSPAVNPSAYINDLYFVALNSRCNVGLDRDGNVRWYTTLDIPSFNTERISNGHFMACDLYAGFNNMLRMYEFDMVGRVHKVYVFDNRYHHSIWQMPDGNIMIPSENTGTSMEDGIAIFDVNTGLEIAYYDCRDVLYPARRQVPNTQNEPDWLHVNQSYLSQHNLIISSARHQSTVFGMDADTMELAFILSNHLDWPEEFQQYLLTPVDEDGNALYDLTDPVDIDRADKEFWNWGQHSVTEIPNSNPRVVEFLILDNGNFRSRDRSMAIIPNDNASRMVHYYIDLDLMTVRIVMQYGMTEVGSRGYSSFVSNAYQLDNENYFINFGGIVVDENGRRRTGTEYPYGSDIDDPLLGDQAEGMVILQEITPDTREVQVELTLRSGRLKNPDEGMIFQEFFSFRARKHPILP